MPNFIALIHKDSASAYGISFPDLPGCFAAADAEADIFDNATEALALNFDDITPESVVATEDLNAIAQLYLEDIKNGAYLLGIPFTVGPHAERTSFGVPIRALPSVGRANDPLCHAFRHAPRSGFAICKRCLPLRMPHHSGRRCVLPPRLGTLGAGQ